MSLLNPVNKAWCLEQICESNYQKIFRLIPDLCETSLRQESTSGKSLDLYVKILDQTAHTLTIELNHCFDGQAADMLVPAVRIRLYLDARTAEVLSDHDRPVIAKVFKDFSFSREILNYKWRLNLFLQKWLDHCLSKGYQVSRQPVLLAGS